MTTCVVWQLMMIPRKTAGLGRIQDHLTRLQPSVWTVLQTRTTADHPPDLREVGTGFSGSAEALSSTCDDLGGQHLLASQTGATVVLLGVRESESEAKR